MKRLFFAIPLLLTVICSYSQELSQVTFSGGATFSSFSFITDQKVIIKISDNGNLLEWGTDPGPGRYYNYPVKLQPYMGRVEYYTREFDSTLNGKVKSIGTCILTYYGSSEASTNAGKLKTIGRAALDYFTNFENESLKGKLKSAGYLLFDYFSSFENEAYKGKLKTVGNTTITYYSTFDDKLIKGKIKSIGSFNYTWYSSHDSKGYQGGLKSGSITQIVNGVTYFIR